MEQLKFMFEGPDGTPLRRDYTPRSFSREQRELTREFALHAQGRASAWPRQARKHGAADFHERLTD